MMFAVCSRLPAGPLMSRSNDRVRERTRCGQPPFILERGMDDTGPRLSDLRERAETLIVSVAALGAALGFASRLTPVGARRSASPHHTRRLSWLEHASTGNTAESSAITCRIQTHDDDHGLLRLRMPKVSAGTRCVNQGSVAPPGLDTECNAPPANSSAPNRPDACIDQPQSRPLHPLARGSVSLRVELIA